MRIEGGGDAAYVPTGHLVYGHQEGGLYVVPFDLDALEVTGTPVPLLDGVQGGGFSRFSISDNGVLVYGTGRGLGRGFTSRLLIVDMDGTTDTLPLEPRVIRNARFSPDGGKIAFDWYLGESFNDQTSRIYWYDMELGGPTQFTFNGQPDRAPVWSPDGSRIVFTRGDGQDVSTGDLYVKDFGGTEAATPLLESSGRLTPTAWTADGTIVLLNEPDGDDDDLFMVSETGGDMTPFLNAEWREANLDVSPNGEWAAYVSNELDQEERGEVFVRRFPGATNQARISEGRADHPHWAPDGQTIYYAVQGTPDQVIAARVQLEPSVLVLERKVVWEGQLLSIDAHPIEDHVLVVELLPLQDSGTEPIETRFYVVVNWFEELRARLGEGN